MSLSNSVVTNVLTPGILNNNRTEFKLDTLFYGSAMKLIDLGIYDTQRGSDIGAYYPSITGVAQTIRSTQLYSGTTLIDSNDNCQQYLSMEALKTSNQGSEDLNRDLLLNGMGFRNTKADGSLTLTPRWTSYYNEIDGDPAVNLQVPIANQAQDFQSGSIPLSYFLKFLKTVDVLPMIPDLRLVIEWDTVGTHYFLDPAHSVGYTGITPQIIAPRLVIDQIVGMNPADAKAYNIPYLSNITERFTIPAVTTPANDLVPLRSSFKSQAFTQRFLKDITFFNYFSSELPGQDQWLKSQTRSPAQKGERIQLVVNNMNHLPDVGIDNPALKFHFFNEAQTQLNLPLIAALDEVRDASNNILSPDTEALQGQFSVTSVKVGKIIDDLRIEYQRLYGAAAWQRESFTLLAFGTVAKNLEVKDGKARVSY